MGPQSRQLCDIGQIIFFSPNMKKNQALPSGISNKEGDLLGWNDLASPFPTLEYNAAGDRAFPRAHKT